MVKYKYSDLPNIHFNLIYIGTTYKQYSKAIYQFILLNQFKNNQKFKYFFSDWLFNVKSW